MKKFRRMNEAAWVFGMVFCALGVALCTKANFGLSMIAAPAYIIHVFARDYIDFYSQGMSEYIWQTFLLAALCFIVRKFKPKYLLTFVCAILFGFAVDGCLFLLGGGAPYESMVLRIAAFAFGTVITAVAIAFYFKTSLPLPVYELVVSEIAGTYKFDIGKVKHINDAVMLGVSLILAFLLTDDFAGIGVGTVVITIVNAPLINFFRKLLDRFCDFSPRFPKIVDKLSI